ncbi:MAG: hypothetical protein E7521_01685 [Ruminococcaceae bacterium]|nr:hypothetical protein [Oscillospiraceae bacterium]
MELLKKDTAWFLSDEGGKKFATLSSLEERTIFIYSYLKTIASESFEKDKTLFKLALFIADIVCNSDVDYNKYPEILKSDSNPFVAFLANAPKFYGNEITYIILTAILHNKVNPFDKSEWIYNEAVIDSDDFIEDLSERGIKLFSTSSLIMIDPENYDIDQKLQQLQLALVWMFLK